MKRSEILENRKKVVEYLKQPERKKGIGQLVSNYDQEYRCCLGHMCESLIPETKGQNPDIFDVNTLLTCYQGELHVAPPLLIEKLGLHDKLGSVIAIGTRNLHASYPSLTQVNDGTHLLPQDIGAYLETVIEGGDDTPWKSLSEYEE